MRIFIFGFLFSLTPFLAPSVECQPFRLSKDELQSITTKTNEKISPDQLEYWDQIAEKLSKNAPFEEQNRLLAYLYNAQYAFAISAKELTGSFSGTLDPISFTIIQLFYPEYKPQPNVGTDAFSKTLAAQIGKKAANRFKEEQAQIHPAAIPSSPEFWHGTMPYGGITTPSMMPWTIKDLNQFKATPPPSPSDKTFWENQLAQVKQAMQQATKEQKQKILFWAAMLGPNSGSWEYIINTYMAEHHTSLEKRMEIRAILAITIFDAMVATFNSKYIYDVKRPLMMDPHLKPFIETPNFPSYPSAHSVICKAVADVMSLYLPENRDQWQELANEAGLSRIWAGIHFPTDHVAGQELGKRIASHILQSCRQEFPENQ